MTDPNPAAANWERAVLEKIALKALDEQRRTRQWTALFRLLWLIVVFIILSAWMGWIGRADKDSSLASTSVRHTALVDLEAAAPIPGPRDLLVEVRAIGINPVDAKIRAGGGPGSPHGDLKILGWDAAGIVRAGGSNVSVAGLSSRPWAHMIAAGILMCACVVSIARYVPSSRSP